MILTGKTKVLGENPVLLSGCPQEFPHGLTCDRNWVSAVAQSFMTRVIKIHLS
jgi:hypothetical protein